MEQNALFRKSALDKLASPERLDVLMQVTSPVGWIALGTMALILVAGLGWSIFGSYPESVAARGLLLQGTGERPIEAKGTGQIESLTVKEGDVVHKDQVIGKIRPIAAGSTGGVINTERDRIMSQYQQSVDQAQARIAESRREANRLGADLQRETTTLRSLRDDLAKKSANRDAYSDAERERARRAVGDSESTIDRLNKSMKDEEETMDVARRSTAAAASVREAALSQLQQQGDVQAESSELRSTFEGRITKILKNVNESVQPNAVVAFVAPTSGQGIRAVFFARSDESPRLKANMPVRLDFGKVYRREEHGQATAKVVEVRNGSARDDELNQLVQNPSYVAKIKEAGPVSIIWAELDQADTPTGVAWTSGRGPSASLDPNMEVTASVEVDRKRPISLVIPFFKKTLGVS